MNNKKYILV